MIRNCPPSSRRSRIGIGSLLCLNSLHATHQNLLLTKGGHRMEGFAYPSRTFDETLRFFRFLVVQVSLRLADKVVETHPISQERAALPAVVSRYRRFSLSDAGRESRTQPCSRKRLRLSDNGVPTMG